MLSWNQYQTNINTIKRMQKCHSLKISNVLRLFPFVMFAFDFFAFAQALHRCLSLAKTFSCFTKNGRSSTEPCFFFVLATCPILLRHSKSALILEAFLYRWWSSGSCFISCSFSSSIIIITIIINFISIWHKNHSSYFQQILLLIKAK